MAFRQRLSVYDIRSNPSQSLAEDLIEELNRLLQEESLYNFGDSSQTLLEALIKKKWTWLLRRKIRKLVKKQALDDEDFVFFNRCVLNFCYPQEIKDSRWRYRCTWLVCRVYRPLHQIFGWVLIPIGLAAISGIIK